MHAFDVISAFDVSFWAANAIKMICRAYKKDRSERIIDLEKSIVYLKREVLCQRQGRFLTEKEKKELELNQDLSQKRHLSQNRKYSPPKKRRLQEIYEKKRDQTNRE